HEVAAERYSPGARTAALWRIVRWYADRAVAAARLTRPGDAHPALTAPETADAATFTEVREAFDWLEAEHPNIMAAIAQAGADLVGQAYAERDLGIVHERLGGYERALAHLHTALAMFQRIGDRYGAASCLNSLGVTHSRQGRYAEAVDCHRRGLAIRQAAGDRT